MILQSLNSFTLVVQVLDKKPLRYTPAGVAVLELVVMHQSEVVEASKVRQLAFETDAIALGDQALQLNKLSEVNKLHLTGFLAVGKKGSGRLKLHIQQFTELS